VEEQNGYIRSLLDMPEMSNEKRYDAACKGILRKRVVLAWILKETVVEYKDCSIDDIAFKYIEPDSINSNTFVGRNLTNIEGLSEEDTTINEGLVRYDLRFKARTPNSDEEAIVSLVVDVEAQNDFNPGYVLEKRAAYYCARQLGSQVDPDTKKVDYNILSKVYSIWICRDVPKYAENTISRYHCVKEDLFGEYNRAKESDYGLMEIIMIRLSKSPDLINEDLVDFLHALFSKMEDSKRMEVFSRIGFDNGIVEEEVNAVRTFSDLIKEEAREEAIAEEREKRFKAAYELIHEDGMSEDKAFRRARITDEEMQDYISWFLKRK